MAAEKEEAAKNFLKDIHRKRILLYLEKLEKNNADFLDHEADIAVSMALTEDDREIRNSLLAEAMKYAENPLQAIARLRAETKNSLLYALKRTPLETLFSEEEITKIQKKLYQLDVLKE